MREKTHEAMSKLRSMRLTARNAYIFFNVHLIAQVCFGYGEIHLSPNQEMILMKISEGMSLRKLALRENFSKKVSRAQKSPLGIELLKPNTIITILSL